MNTKKAQKSASKKAYCKVCPDWEIKQPEKCSNTLMRKGKKVYFCTSKCKERYLKAPEKFV